MKYTASPAIHGESLAPKSSKRVIGAIAVLGGLWLILIDQLHFDWILNPQYSYGWLVPALAVYLFWKRWPTRPDPTRPTFSRTLGVFAAGLTFCLLPTRLVQESAPYWVAVSWTLALLVIGLTLAYLTYIGGWPWTRHFAGAICFFVVAVPWPSSIEIAITQGLMQHVARLTAEILSWAGVYASPQGNLIRLSGGVLGVDEACSGVRSLQSMFMAALFLGELHLLKWLWRITLVVIGLILALICNVIRIFVLAMAANSQGAAALEKWHDPAGYLVLLTTFGGLLLFVRILPQNIPAKSAATLPRCARPLPTIWLLGIAAGIALSELTTYGWYRAHETNTATSGGWRIRWPDSLPGFREVPITSEIRSILQYDEGCSLTWRGKEGSHWLLFFFKWHPTRSSRQAARFHRPEVCIPATGRTLVAERPRVSVPVGGTAMAFRSYVFDDNSRPLYVFFSLREGANGEIEAADMMADSRQTRLRRVFEGRRDLGQQSLEVVIQGFKSAEEAEAAFREQMKSVIVPSPD